MARLNVAARLALAGALSLVGCSAASDDASSNSADAVEAPKPHYLALGDSITFAWNPHLQTDPTKVDARSYHGFADDLGQQLGLTVDNAGCPGEASGSMLDPKAEDNGCRTNRATYALHYPWSKATPDGQTPDTQIDFVRAYMQRAMAGEAKAAPELVTLTIGGNDLLLLQKHCQLPSLLGGACKLLRLPFYVHAYGDHLTSLLEDIDATGYAGTMVLVTTYAPDYSDEVATIGLKQMNGEMKEHVAEVQPRLQHMKVVVADAYAAFESVAAGFGGKTCETGLLISNGDGTCDIHPTADGHALLAKTIRAAIGR